MAALDWAQCPAVERVPGEVARRRGWRVAFAALLQSIGTERVHGVDSHRTTRRHVARDDRRADQNK